MKWLNKLFEKAKPDPADQLIPEFLAVSIPVVRLLATIARTEADHIRIIQAISELRTSLPETGRPDRRALLKANLPQADEAVKAIRKIVNDIRRGNADPEVSRTCIAICVLLERLPEVLARMTAAKAALHPVAAPTLTCAGCGKVYRIGEDAVAVSLEYGLSLARGAAIISEGNVADREDLVAALDVSSNDLPGAQTKAHENWKIIQESLSQGHRRTWRCKACNKVNAYS